MYVPNFGLVIVNFQTNNWQWKFKEDSIKIHYEEHGNESNGATKNILMMPTISDVSTVEEWRSVAKDIIQQSGNANWRATIVDWPGLGYSDRPKLDYNEDVMESFLVDFILARDSPVSSLGKCYVYCTVHTSCNITDYKVDKATLLPFGLAVRGWPNQPRGCEFECRWR